MALVSAKAVRRCLRDLSPEQFAAFVGALWTARGADAHVDADGVVEVRRGGQHRTLRLVTGRRVPPEAAAGELLVLARPASAVRGSDDHDGRVIDADDLHAMLLYAVPRSAADDLCRRFFDRSLVTNSESPRSVAARVPEYSAPLVVGLLGVVLVLTSVLGGPVLYGENLSAFGAPDSVGSDATVEPSPDESTPTDDTPSVDAAAFPPGLGPEGVTDADTLADAHAKAVTGASYRWTLTHREYVDDRPTAYRRETVFVASSTEYRTELEGAGELRRTALVISDVEVYADGETRYERRPVTSEFERTYAVDPAPVQGVRNGEDVYADRAERYLEWHLSVSESAITDTFERGGTRYYWVRLGRDPYAGVENSTGSALIDENGVVHEIRRQYDVPGERGVSAIVSLRYTDFGTTTVDPPAWHEVDTDTVTETGLTTPNTMSPTTPAATATSANATTRTAPTSTPTA